MAMKEALNIAFEVHLFVAHEQFILMGWVLRIV